MRTLICASVIGFQDAFHFSGSFSGRVCDRLAADIGKVFYKRIIISPHFFRFQFGSRSAEVHPKTRYCIRLNIRNLYPDNGCPVFFIALYISRQFFSSCGIEFHNFTGRIFNFQPYRRILKRGKCIVSEKNTAPFRGFLIQPCAFILLNFLIFRLQEQIIIPHSILLRIVQKVIRFPRFFPFALCDQLFHPVHCMVNAKGFNHCRGVRIFSFIGANCQLGAVHRDRSESLRRVGRAAPLFTP